MGSADPAVSWALAFALVAAIVGGRLGGAAMTCRMNTLATRMFALALVAGCAIGVAPSARLGD